MGSKTYHWESTDLRYKKRSFHDRMTAPNKENALYAHLTSNSMLVGLEVQVNLLEIIYTKNSSYSISFRYLKLLEAADEEAIVNTKRLKWGKWLCLGIIDTCYFATRIQSLSWIEAQGVCKKIEASLVTINTELEWHLLQYWFTGRLVTLHMLRNIQLLYMGLRLANVSPY